MSNEWIIAWWEELLYSFVIVLAMANVCMILFVAGLAVAERILRRAVGLQTLRFGDLVEE